MRLYRPFFTVSSVGCVLAVVVALAAPREAQSQGAQGAKTPITSAKQASEPGSAASPEPVAPHTDPSHFHGAMQQAVDKLASTVEEYGGKVGVHIIDVASGKVLAAKNPASALNPASNMKLVTAAVALTKLSANYTFRTALYGKQDATSVADVVLRSYGDPSLQAKDLWELSNGLRRLGIKQVSGDILVDQSYFDNQYVPPGFDQQPNEWAYFRAPVSAVALEANTVTMHVTGTKAGQRAWVSFDPPGFVDISGSVSTTDKDQAQSVTLTLTPKDARLVASIGGSIPEDSPRLRFTQRVDDPTLFAGFALQSILADQGIKVAGTVRAGGQQARRMLVQHRSQRLGTLLERLGKDSDNFYAEMIFKALDGGEKRRGLTSESGANIVRDYLRGVGGWSDGMLIRNGSGLFDTNRLTAQSLTAVLRAMYVHPETRSEYLNHLAVAGQDGTLRSRLRDASTRGRVRAKTGTLASIIALSGYVLNGSQDTRGGQSDIAFSIIVNNVAGKTSGAREAIDTCVRAVAKESRKM